MPTSVESFPPSDILAHTEFQNVFKENSEQWTLPKITDMFTAIRVILRNSLQNGFFS
jgi:hypothetical protein